VRRPRSRVPGTDFAGEVVQTGSAVTDFAVGERVWGLDDGGLGSHAQFLTIRQDAAVARIPDGSTTTRRPPVWKGRTTPSTS
jgi:NADPH:quinone reductase-like Zn-dependent oxidoreductase